MLNIVAVAAEVVAVVVPMALEVRMRMAPKVLGEVVAAYILENGGCWWESLVHLGSKLGTLPGERQGGVMQWENHIRMWLILGGCHMCSEVAAQTEVVHRLGSLAELVAKMWFELVLVGLDHLLIVMVVVLE